jgi:hypothetical protein
MAAQPADHLSKPDRDDASLWNPPGHPTMWTCRPAQVRWVSVPASRKIFPRLLLDHPGPINDHMSYDATTSVSALSL